MVEIKVLLYSIDKICNYLVIGLLDCIYKYAYLDDNCILLLWL
jgi:hypothetical protein